MSYLESDFVGVPSVAQQRLIGGYAGIRHSYARPVPHIPANWIPTHQLPRFYRKDIRSRLRQAVIHRARARVRIRKQTVHRHRSSFSTKFLYTIHHPRHGLAGVPDHLLKWLWGAGKVVKHVYDDPLVQHILFGTGSTLTRRGQAKAHLRLENKL